MQGLVRGEEYVASGAASQSDGDAMDIDESSSGEAFNPITEQDGSSEGDTKEKKKKKKPVRECFAYIADSLATQRGGPTASSAAYDAGDASVPFLERVEHDQLVHELKHHIRTSEPFSAAWVAWATKEGLACNPTVLRPELLRTALRHCAEVAGAGGGKVPPLRKTCILMGKDPFSMTAEEIETLAGKDRVLKDVLPGRARGLLLPDPLRPARLKFLEAMYGEERYEVEEQVVVKESDAGRVLLTGLNVKCVDTQMGAELLSILAGCGTLLDCDMKKVGDTAQCTALYPSLEAATQAVKQLKKKKFCGAPLNVILGG